MRIHLTVVEVLTNDRRVTSGDLGRSYHDFFHDLGGRDENRPAFGSPGDSKKPVDHVLWLSGPDTVARMACVFSRHGRSLE
jgi:hypothetical protein